MRSGVASYIVRPAASGHEVLLLCRAIEPFLGEWFGVEGKVEPGERPEDAILREIEEETQAPVRRLYLEAPEPVIVRGATALVSIHVFVAFTPPDAQVVLNGEHSAFTWLAPDAAIARLPLAAQKAALGRIKARFLDAEPPAAARVR